MDEDVGIADRNGQAESSMDGKKIFEIIPSVVRLSVVLSPLARAFNISIEELVTQAHL